MNLIQVNNLKKVYKTTGEKVHALNDVSLEIFHGDFVAIMGPSGSGKSTLLSLLGGLTHPSGGKVVVDAIDLYDLPVEKLADFRREYIGFVFQSFQLIPYLNVLENVMLPLAVNGSSNRERRRLATSTLEEVGLNSKLLRLPDELSGGEQQRVAIARALVNEPPIILADEPTGNLDTATSAEIMNLFAELNAKGKTIIMVTHNPENAKYSRGIIHLQDGRVDGEEKPRSASS